MMRQTMTLALINSLLLVSPSAASDGQLGLQVAGDGSGGVRIERVLQKSAAEAFGLKEGYRIVAVGSEIVQSEDHFIQLAGRITPGTWQTIDVVGHGVRVSGVVTSQDRRAAERGEHFSVPKRGVVGVALDSNHPEVLGARVLRVDELGPAWRSGLRVGDVIVEVAGARTNSADAAIVAIAARPAMKTTLVVVRGRQVITLVAEPNAADDTGQLTIPASMVADAKSGAGWCDQSGAQTALCVAGGMIVMGAIVAILSDDSKPAKTSKTDATRAAQRAREQTLRRSFEQAMDEQARREGRNPN